MPKDKKQRHKAKREAKKLALRKQNSMSPIKRLALARGELDCRMSDSIEGFGQMQIFVHKQSGSLGGMACFLIDRGVVGLKDAWAKMDVDHVEFEEMVKRAGRIAPLRTVTVDEVRPWVAGAIRWTHDNGMRLPKDWERTVTLIGGAGDWKSADVSAFIKEFAGHPLDLRQRLIGDTFENYIRRDDIRFVFSDDAPFDKTRAYELASSDTFGVLEEADDTNDADDVGEVFDEAFDELQDQFKKMPPEQRQAMLDLADSVLKRLAGLTELWLREHQQEPASELVDAWHLALMCLTMAQASTGAKISNAERTWIVSEMLERLLVRTGATDTVSGVRQVIDYLRANPEFDWEQLAALQPTDGAEIVRPSSLVRSLPEGVEDLK